MWPRLGRFSGFTPPKYRSEICSNNYYAGSNENSRIFNHNTADAGHSA